MPLRNRQSKQVAAGLGHAPGHVLATLNSKVCRRRTCTCICLRFRRCPLREGSRSSPRAVRRAERRQVARPDLRLHRQPHQLARSREHGAGGLPQPRAQLLRNLLRLRRLRRQNLSLQCRSWQGLARCSPLRPRCCRNIIAVGCCFRMRCGGVIDGQQSRGSGEGDCLGGGVTLGVGARRRAGRRLPQDLVRSLVPVVNLPFARGIA